jgi:DNA-directed RNA polymerase subunit beta'
MWRRFSTAKSYVVIDPMETALIRGSGFVRRGCIRTALNEFGPNFKAGMGGEAVRELLRKY